MDNEILESCKGYNNFLFIGEAGCGKSEIAVNFARRIADSNEKEVHFFDLDMTKPLFRSRDLTKELKSFGLHVHFEEQFMDAPVLTGGVNQQLNDTSIYTVLDVGGDYIGARSIGGYAPMINRQDTLIYYVINPYRPWSYDLDHIDLVLGEVLGVSHIDIKKIHMISNPNMGFQTDIDEIVKGNTKLNQLISPYKKLDFVCVREALYEEARQRLDLPVMPLHLYLTYPWD